MRTAGVLVVALLLACSLATDVDPGTGSGQGGAEYPYGGIVNDDNGWLSNNPDSGSGSGSGSHPNNGTHPNEYSFDEARAPLRCVSWPGDAIGSQLDCTATCLDVCEGVADCPCNDNGRGVGCWVPRSLAKNICRDLPGCQVISHYVGDPLQGLHYYPAWAHLGSYPVVQSKGWSATVCDKEEEKGCYECNQECTDDLARQQCFVQAYDYRLYSPTMPFCLAGQNLPRCNAASAESCCHFRANARCDADTASCVEPYPLCPASVIHELTVADVKAGTCARWLRQVMSRERPSLADTCKCLSGLREFLAPANSRFDCAVIPNTQSLRQLLMTCARTEPCSERDRCQGCTIYREQPASPWIQLLDPNELPKSCAFHPTRRQCVLQGAGGVLQQYRACAANENSVIGDEWFWTAEPKATPQPFEEEGERPELDPHPALAPRKQPVKSSKVAPSPAPARSPLPELHPTPVNLDEVFVGNDRTHRHYMDVSGNKTVNFVMPCSEMPAEGTIDAWTVYAGGPGRVHMQVLREVSPPEDLQANPHKVTAYRVVGENILRIPGLGPHTFEIPPQERIDTQKGDVIGFYSKSGVISWSAGGEKVLWRYGKPRTPTLAFPVMLESRAYTSDDLLFVGDGEARTYSVAARGTFPGHAVHVTPSNTPSPEPSPSAVPPSPSNYPSESASPSPAPSPPSHCTQGPTYWCVNATRRAQCNITRALWNRTCRPQPSPSPSVQCDPYMRCPTGFIPRPKPGNESVGCFNPETDCVKSPCNHSNCGLWENDNVGGFGPTDCPYCQGGQDWTGVCAKGKQQSPIEIAWDATEVEPSAMMHVVTEYRALSLPIEHKGWGLTMEGELGTLHIDGVAYDASAVVIRAPAEHRVEGIPRSAVELQIVHRQRFVNQSVFVVSVLFDEDWASDNVEMMKVLDGELPTNSSQSRWVLGFDLNGIVSDEKPMAFYDGSLTLPPCTENVRWGIQMGTNGVLSHAQVANINSLFKENDAFAKGRGNNRMTQPLNGRKILLRSDCGKNGAIACPRGGIPSEVLAAADQDNLFGDEE